MLVSVPVASKSLADYEIFVDPEKIRQIRELAGSLAGKKVLHINATAFGGGVSELLYTLIPLKKDVGLLADWQVIQGSDEFFSVTKIMHNCLQGMDIPITTQMKQIYEHYNQLNAKLLTGFFDFVIVHDPQPVAIPYFLKNHREIGKQWIWRCHLDLTRFQPELWEYLMPFIQMYDATIFTTRAYVDDYVAKLPPTYFITPSIDPLSPKNVPLDENGIKKTLWKYKIDTDDPIITQVSRYDPWKDPLGVIDAYRLVKKEFPKVQLILAASMATDDPESWHYYEKTARRAGEDEDIFLLSNLQGVGNLEINAIQRGSDVVLQKSLQEGFGLTVTEALWKEKAVVGGNVGGIILQIDDGLNGYLVSSVEECAEKVIHLLKHPELAHQMGINGREKVREKFLCLTELEAYLRMLIAIQAGSIDAETNFS